MKKVELLAPAGSFEILKTAINAGADAVYIGGSMFSARASANNFDNKEMIEALNYAHARDVRIYVAINTLIKDEEIKQCLDYILFLYSMGVDAIIIQDIGIITLIRTILPDIPIHFSTQSAISSLADIKSLSNFNIQRVVLPRETNISEISNISQNINIELEAFVHGAICVSYSGRCLFSSLNGGRSGNRGACAQVCRKKYLLEVDKKIVNNKNSEYVLSPKDLKTSNEIDKIIESGVTSLKIEGRMKRKEYIHVCVSSYRQIVDEYMTNGKISEKNILEANYNLEKVFNRSFTSGYILGMKGKNIMNNSYQKPLGEEVAKVIEYNPKNKKLKIKLLKDLQKGDGLDIGENVGRIIHQDNTISEKGLKNEIIYLDFVRDIKKNTIIYRTYDKKYEQELENAQKKLKKLNLSAKIILKLGQNPKLSLAQKNTIFKADIPHTTNRYIDEYTIQNEIDFEIQTSKNSPITEDTIIKQLSKTDTFPFEINDIQIEKDANIFIPVKILNELRRTTLEKLLIKKINTFSRKEKSYDDKNIFVQSKTENNNINLFLDIQSEDCLYKIKNTKNIKAIITSDIDLYKNIQSIYKEKSVYKMPSIVREDHFVKIQQTLEKLDYPKTMFSSYYMIDEQNSYIANYHLNLYNSFSHNYYNKKGIYTLASLENVFVNDDKYLYVKDKSKIIIPSYIYPELMLTEFCPHKDEDGNCLYDYKCKLKDTAIINEQGDRFIFEKFLNCKTAILSNNPYELSQKMIKKYIDNSYNNFLIQVKNENIQDIIKTKFEVYFEK